MRGRELWAPSKNVTVNWVEGTSAGTWVVFASLAQRGICPGPRTSIMTPSRLPAKAVAGFSRTRSSCQNRSAGLWVALHVRRVSFIDFLGSGANEDCYGGIDLTCSRAPLGRAGLSRRR